MKTTKPENFRTWLAALRSGDFRQTTGALRHALDTEEGLVGHCCLGVACAISGLGKWEVADERTMSLGYVIDGHMEASLLPNEVLDWLGVSHDDASTGSLGGWNLDVARHEDDDGYGAYASVAEWNDGGADFNKIADLLEEEYL